MPKESSINTYKKKLNVLKKNGFESFSNIDSVITYLKTKKNNDASSFITAIKYFIKESELSDKTKIRLNEKYSAYQDKLRKRIDKLRSTGEFTKKEQKCFIKWETIKTFAENYENKNSNQYILLCLYTMFPPRRCDYADMYISLDKKPKKMDINKNYLVIPKKSNCYFIFNNYKTNKSFGMQKFIISNDLDSILRTYVKDTNIQTDELLLNIPSHVRLTQILQKLFFDEFGKKASVDMLRHSYLTHMYNNGNLTPKIIKDTSLKMAHSVEAATTYLKKLKYNNNLSVN